MTKRAKNKVHRTIPRRIVVAGGLVVAVALVVVGWVAFREQPQPLEPLSVDSLATSDRELALMLDSARREVEQHPRSARAWGDFGVVLRAHRFDPEAEVCFRNARRLDPADYRWPYFLAVSLATTEPDQSLLNLRLAADLAGDQAHVQLRLAEALLDRNSLDEASTAIDRSLRLDSAEPRALLAKARLLCIRGQLDESRDWCRRSVASSPEQRAPHLLLAQLCRRLGDAEETTREMAVLASISDEVTEWEDPDVETLRSRRGDRGWKIVALDQLTAAGRAPEATRLLDEMARGDDPSGEATVVLVRALLSQNRRSEAEATLREKLTQDPQSERLRFHLGVVLFLQADYDSAAEEFRRAIVLKPDHGDAHYNLAHALRKAGRDSEALEAFVATVRLNPGHAFARANLAELLLDGGRANEARPHLQVAARLAPGDPKVLELLARMSQSQP